MHVLLALGGGLRIRYTRCTSLLLSKIIVHLEILNIVVLLKIWGDIWENQVINIKCDNMAVVEVLKFGKARDPILATCARNI